MDKQAIETLRKAIKILKVQEISIPIGRTNYGDLAYKITESNQYFTLDSVDLDKSTDAELKKLFIA